MTIRELESRTPADGLYDTASQLPRHLQRRAEAALAAGDAARDAIRTPEELAARQAWLRETFVACLGGRPEGDAPLNARVIGTVAGNGYRVEKVIFESRPRVFVTTNLYLPDGITEPRGAVLFVCGHHIQAKHQDEYQIVCQHLVQAGLVVLAMDPVGQGERFSYYETLLGRVTVEPCTRDHDYAGSQCLAVGDTIGRYFLHDAMRAIDYLCTRSEVDPARIGVTGNSGGGTQTSMMMLGDPRLAAAAPATFVMDWCAWMYGGGAQDAEQVWPGTIAAGIDHEDILLGMAPKPVLVLAVKYDFFPIEGTRRTVARAKRIWELFGKSDDLALVEDRCDHQYSPVLATAAAEFFSAHLLGKRVTPQAAKIAAIEPRRLWCTTSGQVRGEIEGARFVHDENLDRLAECEAARARLPESERKSRALVWLREQVFAHRRPCDLNPRPYDTLQVDDLTATVLMWWSQEDLLGHGVVLRHFSFAGKDLPVTIAVWAGGTNSLQPHLAWIRRTCEAGRAVLVLDATGVGALRPNREAGWGDTVYGLGRKLNDDLMFLGDSYAALRSYDVTRAVDALAEIPGLRPDDVHAYGHGRHAVYAQFAAAVDPRLTTLTVEEGMGSYAEWLRKRYYDAQDIRPVVLRGALRYFDLGELA